MMPYRFWVKIPETGTRFKVTVSPAVRKQMIKETKEEFIENTRCFLFKIKWLYSNRNWSSCRQKRRSCVRALEKYKKEDKE